MRKFIKRLGKSERVRAAAGRFLAGYLTLVWKTGRFRFDPPELYSYADDNLPVIFAMWHGQHFLTPFVKKPEHDAVVLISRSGDGEMNAIAAEALGVKTIRGSGDHGGQFARKGGVGAFMDMLRALESGTTVALTADVPKISRRAGLGIVMLARHSGRPILPIAVATRGRLTMKSWDRAAVNLPFSAGAVAAGRPIWVAYDATDEDLEAARLAVETELERTTERAYAIAEGRAEPEPWSVGAIAHLEAERDRAAVSRRERMAERTGAVDVG